MTRKPCRALSAFLFFACLCASPLFARTVNVGFLPGPTALPLAFMQAKPESCTLIRFTAPEKLLRALADNTIDAAPLSLTAVLRLHELSEGKVRIAAVTGRYDFFLVTADPTATAFADLLSKKTYATETGAAFLSYILDTAGIQTGSGIGQVEVVQERDAAAIVAKIRRSEIDFAVLGELHTAELCGPLDLPADRKWTAARLAEKKRARRMLNLQDEYALTERGLRIPALTALAVRADFAAADPDSVRAFLKEAADAYQNAKNAHGAAAAGVKAHRAGVAPYYAVNAVKTGSCTFLPASDAERSIESALRVLSYAHPKIPRAIPPELMLQLPEVRQELHTELETQSEN